MPIPSSIRTLALIATAGCYATGLGGTARAGSLEIASVVARTTSGSGAAAASELPLPAQRSAMGEIRAAAESAHRASGLGAKASYFVVDVATGEVLAEHGAATSRKPASNLKVLTTGAALDILGAGFRFRTQFVLEGTAQGRTVLRVVGDGDPGFCDPETLAGMSMVDSHGASAPPPSADAVLQWVVDRIVAEHQAPLDAIVIDDRIFERTTFAPSWRTDQRLRPYCAEICGLNFHGNMMLVTAAAQNGTARVERLEPAYDWVLERSTVGVAPAKSKSTFTVHRDPLGQRLTVAGKVPSGSRETVDLSTHDTPMLFGELLRRRLADRGVSTGSVVRAGASDLPTAGTTAAVVVTPIANVLQRANTDSSNLHAECLLKRMGFVVANRPAADASAGAATSAPSLPVPGSWTNGAGALRSRLDARIGTAGAGFQIADGCGLSHDNRATAEGLAQWMRSFASDTRLSAPFLESLARAGHTGTVRKRFGQLASSPVEVRCKTGFIDGVCTLTGVVAAPGGRKVAFSVLVNGLEGTSTARAKQFQEELVMAIVGNCAKDEIARAADDGSAKR